MDALDKILFNLETIGTIPKGRKISTAQEFINIDPEGIFQPVWRLTSRDSRGKGVAKVCETIDIAILVVGLLMESKYIDGVVDSSGSDEAVFILWGPKQRSEKDQTITKIKYLYNLLHGCIGGINNLHDTYSDDANVEAQLKPLSKKINDKLASIREFITSLGLPTHDLRHSV